MTGMSLLIKAGQEGPAKQEIQAAQMGNKKRWGT